MTGLICTDEYSICLLADNVSVRVSNIKFHIKL
jgi:hypothetical protein